MSNQLNRRQLLVHASAAMALPPITASLGTVAHSAQAQSSDVTSTALSVLTGLDEAAEDLPDIAIIALNRIAFGPRPGDIEAFNALGSTPDERLSTYVEQQLTPDTIDDSECDAIIAEQSFVTMDLSLEEFWTAYARKIGDENKQNDRHLPLKEVRTATFLRGLHSKRQLTEVLADFWHNHFNVYGWSHWEGPMFRHYDRDVIRKHMFGNFRDMIEAVAKAPAMAYYLDNQSNEGGDPNENFSRELFELHTLGAENYLGVRSQDDPALYDENGEPIGYIDDWVYGATTCFTGWRIDGDSGQYQFDDSRHFPFQKVVLGKILPAFQGEKDGHDVLDMLANHPGTARYVCRKLCRRFISDNPSESIVNAAAEVFLANVEDPNQLQKVIRTILLSNEFKTTWAEKVKRPFDYVVSLMRAIQFDLNPVTNDLYWRYDAAGQSLFARATPDGYPDEKEAWLGTMSMLQRMRICNFMMEWNHPRESDEDPWVKRFRPEEQMPDTVRTPSAVVDYWVDRILGRALPADEYEPIVEFISFGRSWTQDLPADDLSERLRYMISLILMSPTFMLR